MEEFIQTLKGEDADKLEQVIQGRGAFRRFKDMVNRRELLSNGMIFRQIITEIWQLHGARAWH